MTNQKSKKSTARPDHTTKTSQDKTVPKIVKPGSVEVGGPKGPEPTRYGDWEKAGRCSDF